MDPVVTGREEVADEVVILTLRALSSKGANDLDQFRKTFPLPARLDLLQIHTMHEVLHAYAAGGR